MSYQKHFVVKDKAVIRKFIRNNGFATIITIGETYPMASHIPLEMETDEHGNDVLRGHMTLSNPQVEFIQDKSNVLAVFLSQNHQYISHFCCAVKNKMSPFLTPKKQKTL